MLLVNVIRWRTKTLLCCGSELFRAALLLLSSQQHKTAAVFVVLIEKLIVFGLNYSASVKVELNLQNVCRDLVVICHFSVRKPFALLAVASLTDSAPSKSLIGLNVYVLVGVQHCEAD